MSDYNNWKVKQTENVYEIITDKNVHVFIPRLLKPKRFGRIKKLLKRLRTRKGD